MVHKLILLVEDDEDDVFLLRRAAGRAGVKNPIEVMSNGEDAIVHLQAVEAGTQPAPAVIIMDLKMPRKGGLEVLEWLRGQERIRFLPVVIFTSSQQPQDVRAAYELGANSYLVKPSTFDELLAMTAQLGRYWTQANRAPEVD